VRLWQPAKLLGIHVRNEFIGEEKFDAGRDCGINNEFGRLVLGGTASNTVHNGILSSEGID
jgi:hypothetical protein